MKLLIREFREAAGLTRKQLAEMTGVSEGCIYKYEKGLRCPWLPYVVVIARALGCKVDDLMNEEEESA